MSTHVRSSMTGLCVFQDMTKKKCNITAGKKHGILDAKYDSAVRPKLKFYLFPLTRPTLKKGPTQKFLFQFQSRIFLFSQEYFFLVSLQPERIVQCK